MSPITIRTTGKIIIPTIRNNESHDIIMRLHAALTVFQSEKNRRLSRLFFYKNGRQKRNMSHAISPARSTIENVSILYSMKIVIRMSRVYRTTFFSKKILRIRLSTAKNIPTVRIGLQKKSINRIKVSIVCPFRSFVTKFIQFTLLGRDMKKSDPHISYLGNQNSDLYNWKFQNPIYY